MSSLNSVNRNKIQMWHGLLDTPYLTIDKFQNPVVKKKFPLLHLGRNLFSAVNGNRYLPTGRNKNVLSTTTTTISNAFVARFSDFVMFC